MTAALTPTQEEAARRYEVWFSRVASPEEQKQMKKKQVKKPLKKQLKKQLKKINKLFVFRSQARP